MEPIRKTLLAICVLLLLIGIGTEGFMYLEGLSQLDAFYLTVVTFTTVGELTNNNIPTTGFN